MKSLWMMKHMSDKWIDRLKQEAIPRILKEIGSAKIYVFGSRVRGQVTEDSDIDLIIVSNYFTNIPFVQRMSVILRIADFDKHLDIICYTPEEYKKIRYSSSLIQNAIKDQIQIA